MVKTVIFIILFIFTNTELWAQQKQGNVIPNYPDEKMQYSLKYGFFHIGDAEIEFVSNIGCDGSTIRAEAKSSGFVKIIKDIHYKFVCCMDTVTGLPSVSSRRIIEGEFQSINEVHYNHIFRADSSVIYSEETDTLVVPKNILDILTGFYHFRANGIRSELPVGYSDTITTFFIDEVWDLIIRYAGEETIKTEFGMVKCLKFMPVTEISRFFKTNDDMTIWITANKHRIPVKVHVDLKVGSFTAELVGYEFPKRK